MITKSRFSLTLTVSLLAAGLAACEAGVIVDPALPEGVEDDPFADAEAKADGVIALPQAKDGFACSFAMPGGQKVATGYLTMTMSYYSKPNCAGTYVGTDTLTFKNPSPSKTASLIPVSSPLNGVVTTGFSAWANPQILEIRSCPDGTPPQWIEGPGWKFDNYSGGHFTCDYGSACANGVTQACEGGTVSGSSGYECGPSWWEAGKCGFWGALAATTPGVRELWIAITSGNVGAIVAILGSSLGQTALTAVGLLPAIDACACVGSDLFAGCGLNLNEMMSYASDRLRNRAGSFCSYDR